MKFIQFSLGLLLVVSMTSINASTTKATASSFDTAERKVVALSLRQAIEAATNTHPSVRSADIDVEIAGISEKAAWAGYLPNVTISTSAYGDKNSGTSQLNATIAGSQYLIGFAGPRQVAQQAAVDTKIANISRDSTLQQRRALTENVFLTAWLKQEEKKLLEMQFQASKQALHQAKRKFETGLITEVEYKTQIAQTSEAESTVEGHNDILMSAISELEEATGLSLSDDRGVFAKLMWQPNIEQPINKLSFYTDVALNNRLELEVNSAARQRALADENLAKGKLLPTLSAVGEFSCGYSPGSTPETASAASNGLTKGSFFAGVQTSWNVFDRNSSKYEAELARAKALKTSTEREILKKKITKEITKIHSDLKLAQKQAKSLQAQLAASTSTQQQSEQLFAAGLITQAQTTASDAQNYKTQFACLSQVVTFEKSLCALNAACGYAPEVTQELSA